MTPTSQELRRLEKKRARIERMEMDFLKDAGKVFGNGNGIGRKPRRMSAAGRKRIALAQRRRWAAYHRSHMT